MNNLAPDEEYINADFISSSIVEEIMSSISSQVDELKFFRDEPTLVKSEVCKKQIDGLLDCLYEHAEKINNWRISE